MIEIDSWYENWSIIQLSNAFRALFDLWKKNLNRFIDYKHAEMKTAKVRRKKEREAVKDGKTQR